MRDSDPGPSPLDGVIDAGGRELRAAADALAAEMWASELLAMFDSFRMEARQARTEVPPFEEELIARCAARADSSSLVVLAALASACPPPLDGMARHALDRVRGTQPAPGWLDAVGRAEPTRAWIAGDVFGDQESLIVGYSRPAAASHHAIVALVDNNLSGQAKDAFLADEVDEVVTAWKSNDDPHLRLEEAPVELVLGRLRDAMATAEVWDGDTDLRTEEFASHRALVWARLRRAGLGPETHRDPPDVPHEARAELVADFLASPWGRRAATRHPEETVEALAQYLVSLRADYEGRPLRWSPQVAEMVLVDLAPRRLLLSPPEVQGLPDVLRSLVGYAADRNGLDPVFVDDIHAAIDGAESTFFDRMGDPATVSRAEAMLAALEELGPISLGRSGPRRNFDRDDATPEVIEAAAAAPVVARFAALTEFYGKGRKLTQTGQPTLADARVLVSRLGTHDRFDMTIGDRTFKTKSAAELPELGFMIRWAVASGALRKQHGKLLATAGWQKLAGKPLGQWIKAADALPKLGPLEAYFTNARYRSGGEVLDVLAPGLLASLCDAPMPFDDALDLICDEADLRFEWLAPYMQDPDERRRSLGWDLDLLLLILGWAGMAERIGATVEPDKWGDRDRLVGGTIRLTSAARWWLGAEPS